MVNHTKRGTFATLVQRLPASACRRPDTVCFTPAQMKQEGASAFIQSLRADSESSVPLGLDPALLVAAGRGKGLVSPAFLAACVATMDLPLRQCAVVAANGSVMQARILCRFSGAFFCCQQPALAAFCP